MVFVLERRSAVSLWLGDSMSNLLDQYLLFRVVVKRDPEAFARIYDRYVVSIYRFVFVKLPSKEAAEDVTSETFLRCWQFLSKRKQITHLRALLYRIARNLVADHYRKSGLAAVPLDQTVTFSSDEASTLISADLSDSGRGAQNVLLKAEVGLLLGRIARLKEDYQDVLTLRLIEGLSFGDIAVILEKNQGHVRVMYHRARKALENSHYPS